MPLVINGVEAWITVGNKVSVKEYSVDLDEDAGVATCWITGEPGEVSVIGRPTTIAIVLLSLLFPVKGSREPTQIVETPRLCHGCWICFRSLLSQLPLLPLFRSDEQHESLTSIYCCF